MLNANKTKGILFSNRKKVPQIPLLTTTHRLPINFVMSYEYLGITIDEDLTFKPHIDHLPKKLKLKLFS